jgi:hypothetical protein
MEVERSRRKRSAMVQKDTGTIVQINTKNRFSVFAASV